MLSIIYGHENGTPESISWLLCEEQNIGPQVFELDVSLNTDKLFNRIICDNRNTKPMHDHMICMQRMENFGDDSVNFIDHFRIMEEQYDHVVWANYFGRTKNLQSVITGADKLVFCKVDFLEVMLHYTTGYAFTPMTLENIDHHSEIWYQDHHWVDGHDTTQWRELWYSLYHDKMKQHFVDGDLKYMWQLNFAHWDLCHAILRGKDVRDVHLIDSTDLDRLWTNKLQDYSDNSVITQYNINVQAGVDCILIDKPDWIDDIPKILDYLEIPHTRGIDANIERYRSVIEPKKEWFYKTFDTHIRKYNEKL